MLPSHGLQPVKVPFGIREPHCTVSPRPGGHVGHLLQVSWASGLFRSKNVKSLVREHPSVGFNEMKKIEVAKQNSRIPI